MGYDLERFVGYVNEGLLCSVCRDVLERPLQAPCEHAYCSACISAWLLQHQSCPEDRLPLDISTLRPLHRYMRNDLSRLQVRCVNAEQGCDRICPLETLHTHEDECEFTLLRCSNIGGEYLCFHCGCPVQVERRGLEDHLTECGFRSRACPNGCGHTLLSVDQSQHNCVAVLRAEVEMLRAEMLNKVEEVRSEMESRLDSQRRHMVQKESMLKSEVEELKGQLSRVMCDVRALLGAERLRRQQLVEAELRAMQPTRRQDTADQPIRSQQEDQEPMWREQLTRGLKREAAMQASTQSLSSTQSLLVLASPSSPQLGEGPRMAVDCIKKKNREVTVI